ncbi:MAG: DUF547 domain-containing protein [Parvibaculaceae bacterium]
MLLGLSVASPPANRSLEAWQAEWTQVLQRHVDAKGRVDFSGLIGDHTGLEDVVKFVGEVDPASTPALFLTASDRLAYYIDAYNALAMDGVLDAGVPKRFGWLGRLRFFYLRKFVVGGRSISLYSLENDVIRPMGDPRVHFALNCMSVSCPRLPRTAFTTGGIDRELDAAAREFINEDRNVHVDREAHVVRLSAIFDFYTKDFLAKAPSLIAYVNHYRTIPIPSGYGVSFADYNWSINTQSRPEESAR